ncbi:MAG: large conductance mechanosensitive channel protein MscL [Clostridia bacterium]|nr:large conductance mechanosensitive channel protein MscL [Clostridia bacterium]
MKKFFAEFKKFALKGNVMDLAIGVIIGTAFGAIVTALTANFIQPLIASIGGAEVGGVIKLPWVDYSGMSAEEIAERSLNYGAFITAIINFIIIALVLFLLVKAMNRLMSIGKKEEAPADPTTKTCPFCKSEIAIDATRCPNCTSEIPEEPEKEE